jgi:hypothetical protein
MPEKLNVENFIRKVEECTNFRVQMFVRSQKRIQALETANNEKKIHKSEVNNFDRNSWKIIRESGQDFY